MHNVFHPSLIRFIVIFFDDILVYNPTIEDYATHLELVFQINKEHKIFLKKDKCCIAISKVEYLGHFITKEGVSTDPSKV